MDSTRDNLIVRFAAFWWGLGIFLVFALLLAVIWIINGAKPVTDLETVVAKNRYETRATVDKSQTATLSPAAILAAMPTNAQKLAASKPVASPVAPADASPAPAPASDAAPAVIPITPDFPATPAPTELAPQSPNP